MKKRKYKYHLRMIDSVEGDAVYYNAENDTHNYICFPYHKEDVEEIEPTEVSVLKFDKFVNTGFCDFVSMIEYIDQIYLSDKLENPKYKKVSEVAREVKAAKMLLENEYKNYSKSKSEQILAKIRNGETLGYFYPRYIEGKLFDFNSGKKPKYVNGFLRNLKKVLKKEVNFLPTKQLPLKEIRTKSFNTIVDKSITGDYFIVEPVYAGRSRKERADLIKFGEIQTFCMICNEDSHLYNHYMDQDIEALELKDYNKPTFSKLNEAGTYTEFYSLVSQLKNPKVVASPAGLISEEFDKISEEYQSVRGNIENIEYHETSDSNEILSKIKVQGYYALLDWNIALEMKKQAGDSIKIFIIRYDTPIDVGLFYPNNDLKFKNWLEQAIEGSYKVGDSWDSEFQKHMAMSMAKLVHIDDYLVERKINSA